MDTALDIERYRVKHHQKIKLSRFSTRCDQENMNKLEVKKVLMPKVLTAMRDLQERLYAEKKYGLIFVLQAMDAAGKDGTINHVFSQLNPSGLKVASFKTPNSEELSHDYLWRINRELPARGEICVFNRSQYEDVMVTRVHELLKNGSMPQELVGENIWDERYEQIMNWEKYLYQNGFPMIKIFLHVSKKEQQQRLIDRIINKQKNWKFAVSDITERKYWDEYQKFYGEMISKTSTDYAPWYIVPADNKWFTRYVVAHIVIRELQKLKPKFPELSPEVVRQLERFKELIQQVDDVDELLDMSPEEIKAKEEVLEAKAGNKKEEKLKTEKKVK
ncbi:PPK2 family polyphosphate kinase [Allisonella histaminiformans]|uniref:PPK2 family polyphosphate kinase n=1 Tax=Allisonella histaminiformans TaxID=209880 RepID=UPI002E79F65C|nr:PPK2 family polyphosphate kinase [Allisonella histaminiformans]